MHITIMTIVWSRSIPVCFTSRITKRVNTTTTLHILSQLRLVYLELRGFDDIGNVLRAVGTCLPRQDSELVSVRFALETNC